MQQRSDLDKKYLGTCFDRQVRIQLWNQDKLRQQTVLILGVGGLGSVLLMSVLRLGVGKVIVVDYDVVDVHNLNRQVMYGVADVGKRKVDACLENCKFHNIANTEVVGLNFDAVKNWGKVIELAKQSNVVFNCIDYGDKYDISVASLCMALNLPLIMGGTFSTMFTIDYLNSSGKACFLCLGDQAKSNPQLVHKLHPDRILTYQSLQFLPKNNNPTGRSSMMVCVMCAELMVSHYVNWLFLSQDRPYKTTRLIGYHNTFEIIKFDGEIDKKCPYCGDPNYVQPIQQPKQNPIQPQPQPQHQKQPQPQPEPQPQSPSVPEQAQPTDPIQPTEPSQQAQPTHANSTHQQQSLSQQQQQQHKEKSQQAADGKVEL